MAYPIRVYSMLSNCSLKYKDKENIITGKESTCVLFLFIKPHGPWPTPSEFSDMLSNCSLEYKDKENIITGKERTCVLLLFIKPHGLPRQSLQHVIQLFPGV